MKEDEIILKDLKKYLKGMGVKSDLEKGILSKEWYLTVIMGRRFRSFYIIDGLICPVFDPLLPIATIADPEYREKFIKHLKYQYGFVRWMDIR